MLTEELGAFLDDQLNTVDTQGDEGALFSAALLGVELSEAEVAAIEIEDDVIIISVDGENIQAEASLDINKVPVITSSLSEAIGTVIEAGILDDGTSTAGIPSVSGQLSAVDEDVDASLTWSIGDVYKRQSLQCSQKSLAHSLMIN